MVYGWKSWILWKFGGGGGRRRRSRTAISSIPEEVISEILLKLPVKSVLACKCVCKHWYALISTSQFVKKHHHLAIQKNNPILVLKYGIHLYSICYDSLPSSVCEIVDYVSEIKHPLQSSGYCVGFLGSCNGLICIWLFKDGGGRNIFCLWNPATREYKELPESTIGFNSYNVCIHGLGYDHKTGDYKLAIGVKVPLSKSTTTLVQFYSLASNSWKAAKTIPYWFWYMETSGVLFHENLHWLALGLQNGILLLSLDVNDENFKEMQLPTEILERNEQDLCWGVVRGCLGVLHGYLCFFFSSYVNGVQSHFEVWEMLDYGINESWTKHYVIAHESIINDQRYFRRVWSFKKDEILLLGSDSLVSYDPKHGSARKPDRISYQNAETYLESLVSLNSGTYMAGEAAGRVRNSTKLRNYCFYFMVLIGVYLLYVALF